MDFRDDIREAKQKKSKRLYLGEYDLLKIPTEVFELTDLEILHLDGNYITEIPEQILFLKNLKELYLDGNQISEFPRNILNLTELEILNLSSNQISFIPKEIIQLTNLKVLKLNGNQISELPEGFAKLRNIVELHLENNKLSDISKEITLLHNIVELNLSGNRITQIPKEVVRLRSLKKLFLSFNKIKVLPKEIAHIRGLQEMYLINNMINEVPIGITALSYLKILDLSKNEIKNVPVEIIDKGFREIRNYLNSIARGKTEKLYEAKLIIVGQGGVGKTCLSKKLADNDYSINRNGSSTEGIAIENWNWNWYHDMKDSEFKVNIWDFGGQEIYHATHQFFLTRRSLYIFVWDARTENEYSSFDYWLNIISLLSNKSPVIIVLNKSDERKKEVDEALLKSSFNNIIDFFEVSCLDGSGIKELTHKIKETIVSLPQVGNDWPSNWSDIRRELESSERDYIEYTEYKEICLRYGLNEESANYLSSYLHDLGVILHFQDDHILKNTVILKPKWGTRAVYKILDTKEVQESKGRFSSKELENIWENSRYPIERHIELLQLMMKFELCFKLIDSNQYIVPELLPSERPNFEWNSENNLRFEYHYRFMPAGIITRFIVRVHNSIEGSMYWKNGVILAHEKARALVISEPLNRKIKISIDGSYKTEILATIRSEFEKIHKTINNPEVVEKIPCVCGKCKTGEPYFYEYEVLKRRRLKGRKYITCNKSDEDIAIEVLLSEV